MTTCVFADPEELVVLNPSVKWSGLGDVLTGVAPSDPGHMRSRGDTITFRTGGARTWSQPHLTAHRLYQTVFMVLRGEATIEIAPRRDLRVVRRYCDLDDCEHLEGVGRPIRLGAARVVCVGLDDAWRVRDGDAVLCQARITIEGAPLVPPAQRGARGEPAAMEGRA
ncbi:hypothetical protein ACFQ23_08660 [Schaalia naturae]|uniref:Cupin domain-containing protein n=1 Tax=Schaalia naturae TaxID=635203 RepID=A0ABW2SP45_9ACTO